MKLCFYVSFFDALINFYALYYGFILLFFISTVEIMSYLPLICWLFKCRPPLLVRIITLLKGQDSKGTKVRFKVQFSFCEFFKLCRFWCKILLIFTISWIRLMWVLLLFSKYFNAYLSIVWWILWIYTFNLNIF